MVLLTKITLWRSCEAPAVTLTTRIASSCRIEYAMRPMTTGLGTGSEGPRTNNRYIVAIMLPMLPQHTAAAAHAKVKAHADQCTAMAFYVEEKEYRNS